ncbi:MAG: 16S rRNA (guanine(966)-N(2))-methyltransferase RsmD [Rhodobacteraceae bacterium]|nr:16S rRNA (guanine(966)-N(2))-methyltransferase RsmD [Paracoccaceae bacterium]
MRIIAGQHRGRALTPLGKGDSAAHLRPTADRVRESLFSRLVHLDAVAEAVALDLCAGTGALGLEALSRGAAFASFVENGRIGAGLLRRNIALLNESARCRVWTVDATRLPAADRAHDLVFLDPPYGKGLGARILAAARAGGWLAPAALIVWEEDAPMPAPEGFTLEDHRRHGDTHVTLLRHDEGLA